MKQLIFLLLLLPVFSYTQNRDQVDSLSTFIESAKLNKDWKALINLHFKKGELYYLEDEDSEALLEYLKVDSIAQKNNYTSNTTIIATIHRAKISRNTFTYDGTENANTLLLEALETSKINKNEETIYMAYKELAYTKGLKGENAEAKKYADLAFPYYFEKDDLNSVSWLYSVYYMYYYAVDSLDKAKQVHTERLSYFRTKSDSLELANSLRAFADFYMREKKNYSLAFPYLLEAKTIYEKTGNEKLRDYLYLIENLALCHAEENNYEIAYDFYKQAYNLRKVIVRESNNNLTRKLEAKHQAKKREQEITLLQSQKELAEQQKANQRNLLLGGLVITTLVSLSFFFLYRDRQKTNKKLRELDAAKSIFFANITHEFRTPLTVILGLVEKSRQYFISKNTTKFQEVNDIVQRNSHRLLNLVNQMLDLSRLESKSIRQEIVCGDIVYFLQNLVAMYESHAENFNLRLAFESTLHELKMDFDPENLQKIVSNLLTNAIKFTDKGSVILRLSEQSVKDHRCAKIQIKDTGIGIANEDATKIFERFYQVKTVDNNKSYEGSGIGMSLVKELVELMGGQVDISSQPGEGTVVTFTLPITKRAPLLADPRDVVNMTVEQVPEQPFELENQIEQEGLPIVLLIEDNQDVLYYLQACLADHYQLIQAVDGEDGISKALEHIPDIIISDVMMPNKTGFEVCEILKLDTRTSHIPIIILTAKAEIQDKISGIRYGADAYLIKPFNVDELLAQVNNLIRSRELLRVKFSSIGVDDAIKIDLPPKENEFLSNLNELIKKELSNPDLNVEIVCEQLYMSRTQLHRKIKALTDKSITAYVRSYRLHEAMKMIQQTSNTIQQIAYETGFSDASYFHRTFVKEFHKKPTDFRNE